jgi:hypothetical protein
MLDASAVKELAAQSARPHIAKVGGIEYAFVPSGDGKWQLATGVSIRPLGPDPLNFRTLTGLADYLKADNDDLRGPEKLALHVCDHQVVRLVGSLGVDAFSSRHTYAVATVGLSSFGFGHFLEQEIFQIALQTQFVDTPEREELLKFIASVKSGPAREVVDDRVAQMVTTRRGVQMSAATPVPSPINLRPFRTFRDVDQPVSPFVFRARGGGDDETPEFALFAADGDVWTLNAIASIAAKLKELAPEVQVLA